MTIELSLRRRATHARCLAILWLSLAVAMLVGTYATFPFFADKTLSAVSRIDGETQGASNNVKDDVKEAKSAILYVQLFAMATLILVLSVVLFACYLLGRSAFIETELAARFSGLADAICIAGNDFGQLEKAAAILVPQAKFLSVPKLFSVKDLKPWADVLKQMR